MIEIKKEYPVERCLCVLRTINGLFILGYLNGIQFKIYGKNHYLPDSAIRAWQYVENSEGGFYKINEKVKPDNIFRRICKLFRKLIESKL